MIYLSKIFKGGISTSKNVGGVTVLNLCTSSDHILHLNQVSQKYLNGFPSYLADMISLLKFSKWHKIVINV